MGKFKFEFEVPMLAQLKTSLDAKLPMWDDNDHEIMRQAVDFLEKKREEMIQSQLKNIDLRVLTEEVRRYTLQLGDHVNAIRYPDIPDNSTLEALADEQKEKSIHHGKKSRNKK